MKELSILIFLTFGIFPAAAQSIGPHRGEMYFLLEWYFEPWQPSVSGLFYTTDHGRHFAVIDTFANNPSWFPFGAGFVMADATPGVLYRLTESDFSLSIDQANTWQDLAQSYPFADYATGNQPNEICRRSNNMLFKSTDNGHTWELKNDSLRGRLLSGNKPDEIFYYTTRKPENSAPIEITLFHSINEGQNFVSHAMDAFLTDGSVRLVKGSLDGEFYLVVESSVTETLSIFRTIDYGENFTLQYTMEIPHYCHFLAFTAGKEMCDFYIGIYQPLCMCSSGFAQLTLMHSSDCAQTFSTYHHQFISNYEGNPISITHTVTPEAFPPQAGFVSGGGVFDHGQNVTLTAEPLQGYSFAYWSEKDEVVSVDAEFVFAVKDSRRIVARFETAKQIENPENEKYALHPNPSREQVIFTVPGFNQADKLYLEIFNLQGQQLDRVLITQIETQINVSSLEPGMLFYRISRNGSVEGYGKMMVVR